ncbi:MAG: GNAT family N-acetyltransferase [bacterium]
MTDQPELVTDRLRLRPFEPTDALRVQQLAGDPAVADTTVNIPHPYPDGAAESWIASHRPGWIDGIGVTFAITDRVSGDLRGAIGLVINPEHRRAELGYWIAVDHWKQGLCTEAARAVIGFAFETLGLHRIYATYLVRNPASGQVMQKAGMQFEGVQRGVFLKNGVFEDVAMCAIVRGDR